jgi:hypothetical protein
MDLDADFILKAKEIRESMNVTKHINYPNHPNNPTQPNHTSKYNINKIISLCEICKVANACDVHHINQQYANENNIINDNENGIFNKNKLWNLVSLCKECHQSIHSVPQKINVEGYINTSAGIELKYEIIDDHTKDDDNNDTKKTKNIKKTTQNEYNDNITIETASKHSSKTREPLKINELIISLKKSGMSPKKIQYDLKREYNYEITQQYIRNII